MALKDIQARFRALAEESQTIAAKADMDDADLVRLEEITAEGQKLERQKAALKASGEFVDNANKSAGMLGLVGFKPAGEAHVDTKGPNPAIKAFKDDSGDLIIPQAQWDAISSPEYGQAFKAYLRKGREGLKYEAIKVLQEGIDTAGGFLVPADEIWSRIIAREPAPQTLASRVTMMNTSRDSLTIPKVTYTTDNIYTSGMRVTWSGEVPASSTVHRVTEPVFGMETVPIYTAMMSLPLSNDMVEDAAYPIVQWCTAKFGETRDLLFENMIINGTGIGQPSGILINANFITNDVHTGVAAALTWDGMVNLLYALPEQYDRNAVVVMNKTSGALALAKLVDGDGRPYWAQGNSGLVDQAINRPLLGYPVVFNAFMPDLASAAYPVIFGDFSGYYLVNRVGFSIQVLRERYAEDNQVVLLGRLRFGGRLVEDFRLRGHVASA